MIEPVIALFNQKAGESQTSEFRTPKTPEEWQRMQRASPQRNYEQLLGVVVPVIEAFIAATDQERSAAARQLNSDSLGILRTFAKAASVLAVRQRSPALLEQGLTAVAILGEVDDLRDLMF